MITSFVSVYLILQKHMSFFFFFLIFIYNLSSYSRINYENKAKWYNRILSKPRIPKYIVIVHPRNYCKDGYPYGHTWYVVLLYSLVSTHPRCWISGCTSRKFYELYPHFFLSSCSDDSSGFYYSKSNGYKTYTYHSRFNLYIFYLQNC